MCSVKRRGFLRKQTNLKHAQLLQHCQIGGNRFNVVCLLQYRTDYSKQAQGWLLWALNFKYDLKDGFHKKIKTSESYSFVYPPCRSFYLFSKMFPTSDQNLLIRRPVLYHLGASILHSPEPVLHHPMSNDKMATTYQLNSL